MWRFWPLLQGFDNHVAVLAHLLVFSGCLVHANFVFKKKRSDRTQSRTAVHPQCWCGTTDSWGVFVCFFCSVKRWQLQLLYLSAWRMTSSCSVAKVNLVFLLHNPHFPRHPVQWQRNTNTKAVLNSCSWWWQRAKKLCDTERNQKNICQWKQCCLQRHSIELTFFYNCKGWI